ncbi:phage holin family protein [Flavobacterium sp. ALJ2]|uniref:phage holin family protein n=1 Tax=Flavobacterium sp. ALJ2 TaxID=2786960 RepID=UPI00189F02D6|nr:phage holin family protein [Flavobacterium sp. ALJ2]MBF7090445.1 phage holin family protein [Flavobacterium sp. ALJ2]
MKNLLIFPLIAMLFKKPALLVATVPVIAITKLVVDFESVAWILFYMLILDLVTGLLASYCVWRKSDRLERWFFGKGEGFSSDKFKRMGLKVLVYLGVPFMIIKFQEVLMLKNFKYDRVSEAEFELATIAIIVFCLNEGFSIFHENLPKCGFNLWERLKKMIGFYKEIKNEITE